MIHRIRTDPPLTTEKLKEIYKSIIARTSSYFFNSFIFQFAENIYYTVTSESLSDRNHI